MRRLISLLMRINSGIILLFFVSNPEKTIGQTIEFLGSYETPGGPINVFIDEPYAYVADRGSGLQIIDISEPTMPTLIGSYDTPGEAFGIFVQNDYAFIGDYGSGLQIIDISEPSSPTLIGSYDTPGIAMGLYVFDGYIYIADVSALLILNISNPASPSLVGLCDTPEEARDVFIKGSYAYVADWTFGIQIIDISNPTSPTIIGNYDTPRYCNRVVIQDNLAYLADGESGMQIVDISDALNPLLVGNYDTPGNSYGIFVDGDYAYIADYGTLEIINVENPSLPIYSGSYDTQGVAAYGVFYICPKIYVVDYASLTILQYDVCYSISNFHLIGPIDNSVVIEPNPSLIWQPSTDPDSGYTVLYNVIWDEDPSFNTYDSSGYIPDTSYAVLEGMNRSTTYYWRVLADNGHAASKYSIETWDFYIDGYPTIPGILGPENGSEATAETYLSWLLAADPDPMDTVSYSLQADDDNQFGSPEIDASGITPSGLRLDEAMAIMLGELPGFEDLQENQLYYWRVRSDDLFGLSSEWTSGPNYFVVSAINDPPNTPIDGFSPANSEEVISLTPVMTWNYATDPDPSDNAENLSYAIRLSQNPDFSGYVYSDTTDPGINQIQPIEELEDNSHYYYGVMTIDDEGLSSAWSGTQDFWTNHYNFPPEPFPIYGPEDSTMQVVYYTDFTWGNTIDYDPLSSFTFTFEYSTNSQFENPVISREGLTETTLTIETDSLASLGQDLFWRVKAVDDDGLIRIGGIPEEEVRFLKILPPGDANSSGTVNIADVVYLFAFLKGSGDAPDPLYAGDANGNCVVNIADVVYLFSFLKGDGDPPIRGDCQGILILKEDAPAKAPE